MTETQLNDLLNTGTMEARIERVARGWYARARRSTWWCLNIWGDADDIPLLGLCHDKLLRMEPGHPGSYYITAVSNHLCDQFRRAERMRNKARKAELKRHPEYRPYYVITKRSHHGGAQRGEKLTSSISVGGGQVLLPHEYGDDNPVLERVRINKFWGDSVSTSREQTAYLLKIARAARERGDVPPDFPAAYEYSLGVVLDCLYKGVFTKEEAAEEIALLVDDSRAVSTKWTTPNDIERALGIPLSQPAEHSAAYEQALAALNAAARAVKPE